MATPPSPSTQRCALFVVAALLIGLLVGPRCESAVAGGGAPMNGVIFEYDAGTGRLSARIDPSSGDEAVAIPNSNTRIGFLEHGGRRLNLDGSSLSDTEGKLISGWDPADIVVLREGMRVEYDVSESTPGDIHVHVFEVDYTDEVKRIYGRAGVPLWSGELVVRRPRVD